LRFAPARHVQTLGFVSRARNVNRNQETGLLIMLNPQHLTDKFARMGARVKVGTIRPRSRWDNSADELRIDVRQDGDGEFFEILERPGRVAEMFPLAVDAQDRHLLLFARVLDGAEKEQKRRFLCGHDERHWFVAAVPGNASTVRTAKQALKPDLVRAREALAGLPTNERHRRRNAVFLRQGEWFFTPEAGLSFPDLFILRNEPLRRGGGKPHRCEFLVRSGGEQVYVHPVYPNGLTEKEYTAVLARKPKLRDGRWTSMRRNPGVYVKGRVSHPDHKTILLPCWHFVSLNTEREAPGAKFVAFLD
jgi:hypothetical protein